MAVWDALMPTVFTDGQTVDEGDLEPIAKNVATVRYATVFEGGQRRTTIVNTGSGVGSGNEIEILRTPSFVMENGYLYFVHGLVIWRPGATSIRPELRLHEGAGLGGAFLPLTLEPASVASTNYGFSFGKYFKAGSTASQQFTVGFFKAAGASSSVDIREKS